MHNIVIIRTIAAREYRALIRDRTVPVLACIIWLLTGFACYTGWQRLHDETTQRQRAESRFREEWNEQHTNPHSAAHFGTYLFKPAAVLSSYDNGLNTYLGTTYRVEAHVQHELNGSEAESADSRLRFGELSVAMVFQLLTPLLILLITFNAVSREREGGTLRMLILQGVRPLTLIWGKIAGAYAAVLTAVFPVFIVLAIPVIIQSPAAGMRYALLTAIYLLYFLLFTGLGVVLSASLRRSSSSIVACLGIWLCMTVLFPRAATRIIDYRDPLPSRFELNRNISSGYQQGMGSDGTSKERSRQYMEATLKKYNVDTVTKLPVNFDGLVMQYGEDYNSKVYGHYAGQAENIIRRQQERLERWSVFAPYIGMQQLSMALSGTDYHHHLAFHHQARAYRDTFIRTLNMQLANSGSKYLTYDYKVDTAFFSAMPSFRFHPPSVKASIGNHPWALYALGIWLVLLYMILIPVTAKRMKL